MLDEGSDWLVADKPAGVAVHEGADSLLSALAARAGGADELLRPVHRVDLGTAGVVLFAKTAEAATRLQRELARPKTEKCYRAICRGRPRSSSGIMSQRISPRAEGRRNPRGVSATRVEAVTHFRQLGSTEHLCFVEFSLQSGRTHQIRKHCAINGFPVLGDRRYGDPRHAAQMERRFGFSGIALHAARLSLCVEADAPPRHFESSLPDEWAGLLAPFGQLPTPREACVEIRSAGPKGMGAFATGPLPAGTFVTTYRGEIVSLAQLCSNESPYTTADPTCLGRLVADASDISEPCYLFEVRAGRYIDGMRSAHFSRFFNHAEVGSLNFTVDASNDEVAFYAARDVAWGDELTFDCISRLK